MSPQLLWTIAGLILTVLTLGGVSISSYQSMDSATAKLVGAEIGNLATASKLWLANDAAANSFTGISGTVVNKYIPDLALGSGADSAKLKSKASEGVLYTLAADTDPSKIKITATWPAGATGDALAALVETTLTNKACTPAKTINAGGSYVVYTCNG